MCVWVRLSEQEKEITAQESIERSSVSLAISFLLSFSSLSSPPVFFLGIRCKESDKHISQKLGAAAIELTKWN